MRALSEPLGGRALLRAEGFLELASSIRGMMGQAVLAPNLDDYPGVVDHWAGLLRRAG